MSFGNYLEFEGTVEKKKTKVETMDKNKVGHSNSFITEYKIDSRFLAPHILEDQEKNDSLRYDYDNICYSSEPSGNLDQDGYSLCRSIERISNFDTVKIIATLENNLRHHKTASGVLGSSSLEIPSVNE